ncbi:hypothetical protein [Burkholderia gladioli]|uniref:hypothetical protein n=1 Tax=Burkholderia gladioli TaxID=28095 RepID=UPI0016408393|nr:hypothetical protein [Burkholderia gladioli]
MQSTQTPTLVPLAFAANGTKNAIPEASQIDVTPGAASLNDGFPPLTMTPIAAGGVPPSGSDFNGVLNLITQSIRWAHAGGAYTWNSGFATDPNVEGYPKGSVLMRADLTGFWISTTEGNATNPDATDGSAAGWVPGYNYGTTSVAGLTNANLTLTPAQASKSRITFAGALTGNVSIVFPVWTKEWTIVNNTTGAFTLTATTAGGAGVVLPAGQSRITGDGTNIVQLPESVGHASTGTQAAQLGQIAVIGNARGVIASLSAAATSITYTATAITAKAAIDGISAILTGYTQTLNLATVGAGGMDAGSAPASGYVGIYAIYNPATNTQSILATNATTAAVPEQYGGTNAPAGFTHSQLLGIWPTNGSGQLVVGAQRDRLFTFIPLSALTATSVIPTPTALNISTIVPKNASAVGGVANVTSGDANPTDLYVYSIANSSMPNLIFGAAAAITVTMPYAEIPIITPQVLWCSLSSSSIAFSANLTICSFRF